MQENNSQYYIPLSIIIAGALIAFAVFLNKGPTATEQQVATKQPAKAVAIVIKNINTSTTSDPYIGDENAPVTIALWTDYQCPWCKAFEVPTANSIPVIPDLVKNYVNTGKLRIIFKDYQFLGQDSLTAAIYARAVWDLYPDKYFEWRTAMYNAQDGENSGFGDQTSIVALTKTISGIDESKIEKDVETNKAKYQQAIIDDLNSGSKFGVSGTPTVGAPLLGDGSYIGLSQIIDSELKAK